MGVNLLIFFCYVTWCFINHHFSIWGMNLSQVKRWKNQIRKVACWLNCTCKLSAVTSHRVKESVAQDFRNRSIYVGQLDFDKMWTPSANPKKYPFSFEMIFPKLLIPTFYFIVYRKIIHRWTKLVYLWLIVEDGRMVIFIWGKKDTACPGEAYCFNWNTQKLSEIS